MMATDALASWLFRQIERKDINWEDLIWLTDQGHFADFVDEQRRSGQLVDDDIMLIISSL